MKFNISIECESVDEFRWVSAMFNPVATIPVGVEKPVAIATPPNGADGEAAPEAVEARKRGRPRKEAPAPVVEAEAPPPAAPPASKPKGIPTLQPLKDAITTHARLAMRGEGDKKILDLLPAFRDATGLDFVMNAEEQHREALYELAIAAGVPLT